MLSGFEIKRYFRGIYHLSSSFYPVLLSPFRGPVEKKIVYSFSIKKCVCVYRCVFNFSNFLNKRWLTIYAILNLLSLNIFWISQGNFNFSYIVCGCTIVQLIPQLISFLLFLRKC